MSLLYGTLRIPAFQYGISKQASLYTVILITDNIFNN